jgi:hypothetical protein
MNIRRASAPFGLSLIVVKSQERLHLLPQVGVIAAGLCQAGRPL